MNTQWLRLLRHFAARDLQQRYLGSLSGVVWVFLHPLLLLAIYSTIFIAVLKVRLPTAAGADFVVFLVGGLWPWMAFSEALGRSVTALTDHAGLLAKVALPREVLVLAPVLGGFALQVLGFLFVLLVLAAFGKPVHWLGIGVTLLGFTALAAFTVGLALALAPAQVFIRDLSHVLAQVLTLWFFLTPIFYSTQMAPPLLAHLLRFNPLGAYINAIREPLLGRPWEALPWLVGAVCLAAVSVALGVGVFRRLHRHIEDFL